MAVLLFWCGSGAAAAEAYVDFVPLPADPPAPQASVLYYSDGRTILARVGTVDHSDVPLSSVPVYVQHAVLAAEDRDFYGHPGVSARGIVRAALAVVKGGSQGASTVTQQYTRNAFLTQDFSVGRKAKEIALAVKLERRYSKNEILAKYLNTIYYGRGAYGIAAAAHAFFDVTPDQLTLAQGAVIAAVIKDPWHLDPANDPARAKERWSWVIDAMYEQGWIDRATADAQRYPTVQSRWASSEKLDGPTGLVVDQVEQELATHGVTSQMLHTAGLSIVTTLDATSQQAALDLVEATLRGQPAKLRAALVAVDPASGGVRAYYGGDRGRGYFDDAVAPRPPASTFKPIVLAAALRRGIGYLSRWDGTSPRSFPGRLGVPLFNRDNLQYPDCTLETAMVQSLNTPFYALAEQIGADAVQGMAVGLGISPKYDGKKSMVDAEGEPSPGRTRPDIAIGRYAVTPADLASVYATFAAGGVRSIRHFVQSVASPDRQLQWTAEPDRRRMLDAEIAADVSVVLRAVVEHHRLAPGRPAAGKTGTQQWADTSDNQDAWMAGYTPQLAVAVWMGQAVPGKIRDASGKPISGETLPAQLWREFLTRALDGDNEVAFPAAAHVGRVDVGDARSSTNPSGESTGAPTEKPVGKPTGETTGPGKEDAQDESRPSPDPTSKGQQGGTDKQASQAPPGTGLKSSPRPRRRRPPGTG